MLSVAELLRTTTAFAQSPIDRVFNERILAVVRSQLSAKDFTVTWDEGRNLTPEQALTFQEPLAFPIEPSPSLEIASAFPLSYSDILTQREMAVLRLVAQGLTDKEVAEQLVISPRTVQGHVRSIFNKLQVNSRSSATRYAIEHNLV